MEIFLYSNCTSCKKAERALAASGKPYQSRDYFNQRFTVDELASVLERAGVTVRDVLSTRSRAYGALGLAEKQLSDEDLLALMVEEPTLLRRPLIVGNGASVIGFNAERVSALIEQA